MISLSVELAATGMTNYKGEALPVEKLVDLTDDVRLRGAYTRVAYTTLENGERIAILEICQGSDPILCWKTQARAAFIMNDLRDMAHSAKHDALATFAKKLGVQKAKLAAILEEGAPKD